MAKLLTLGGLECLDPGQSYVNALANRTPLDFWQRANSYTCPLGKEPGSAWVLMKRKDLDALDKNAYHELKIWETHPGTTQIDPERTATIAALRIVRDLCMDKAFPPDVKACRLIELQDKRRQLKLSSINSQYNVRIPAPSITSGPELYYSGSLDGSSTWTWQTMLGNIWGNLPSGLAGTHPTLPYTPDGTPEGWRFIGVSAWDALHSVLGKISVTTVYDPIDDSFSYIELGTTQDGLSKELEVLEDRRIYDYDPGKDYQHDMPATVRVFFPRRELYHGTEKDTPDVDNWEMSPTVSKDYATGITGATTGTVTAVWDDLPATFDSTGTNTNSAALQTRADELGESLANRVDVSQERSRAIYAGVTTDVLPGSQVSEVVWRDYGDDTGLVTEIMLRPDGFQKVSSQKPSRNFSETSEHLTTHDFMRNQYPLWPRLTQPVQADDGASTIGDQIEPNASGLIPGFVRRWASGSYTGLDACWIRPVDLEHAAVPSESTVIGLRQKGRYIGRLSGSDTVSAETRPTYLVSRGGELGRKFVRFTLTNALTTSEEFETANITNEYGPGLEAPTAAITVHNLLTSVAGVYVFEGNVGDAGYAFWDADDDYQIMQMECP